ncbi:MAG: rhodanese-like domain-containing protein [Actinomycetota bacterium]
MSVDELRETMGGYIVLDVREDDEWDLGYVEGAVHVSMAQLPDHIGDIDRSARVACICRSGNRSAKVTAWMLSKGFDVRNVTGGMIAWESRGFPVALGAQA